MNELFKNEIREAGDKLYNKRSYVIANMEGCYNDQFEIYVQNADVIIDHLSIKQLIDLANLL